MNFTFLDKYFGYYLKGAEITIVVAFFGVLFGTILGLGITLLRRSKIKIIKFIGTAYVEFVRGTPLLVQIYIIYIGLPNLIGMDLPDIIVGIIALALNAAAYVSEILRAMIEAVDKGQMEAGLALGLSYGKVMRYIILPQAIRNILPALGNEFITLLKETSAGAYIGILELTKASDIIASRTYDYFFPLIITALIYLIMTLGLSKLVNVMERRLSNARS